MQDEWGIYDPAQAGLAALVRRVMREPHHEVDATSTPH
jgi:hypothetical protein